MTQTTQTTEPNNIAVLATALTALLNTKNAKNPTNPASGDAGDNEPFVIIKSSENAEKVESLEHLLSNPTRKRGAYNFADAKSFTTYHAKHAGEHTELFGNLSRGHFTCVFNTHSSTKAGWGDHKAHYKCPTSREWDTWTKGDKVQSKQEDFAQFIENNLLDIVEPSGADMLEISRSLAATKKVNFKSGIKLSNGELELAYEETIEGTSAKGKLKIPESFFIAIPVLTGGAPYKIEARLRYRITDASLVMWYDLLRPHKSFEDAVQAAWTEIETKTGGMILHEA